MGVDMFDRVSRHTKAPLLVVIAASCRCPRADEISWDSVCVLEFWEGGVCVGVLHLLLQEMYTRIDSCSCGQKHTEAHLRQNGF